MRRTLDTYDHIARKLFEKWLNFNDVYSGETRRQDIWTRLIETLENMERIEREMYAPFVVPAAGRGETFQNLECLDPNAKLFTGAQPHSE